MLFCIHPIYFMLSVSTQQDHVDYLIVGQGLAGSVLAFQAIRHGKKIRVIDEPDENVCTRVAPGMFNPVTGKNLVKSWLTDELYPYLHKFYPLLEQELGQRFFYSLPLYRPFATESEQHLWIERGRDPIYRSVLSDVYTSSQSADLNDDFGGLMLKQCGYINTIVLLDGIRRYLTAQNSYTISHFNHEELRVESDGVRYGGTSASYIIFCEGARVLSNPWFRDLPIRPLKGEVLDINSQFDQQVIINRSVYMVPSVQPQKWRVGSTYQLREVVPGTTTEGRNEIEEKLKSVFKGNYRVDNQYWGIRPTSVDRRPMLGSRAKSHRVVIFNGLGTKGVSLAPYFSDMLIQWLEGTCTLNKEVDVNRFKSLY